jgi:hypothetical protein
MSKPQLIAEMIAWASEASPDVREFASPATIERYLIAHNDSVTRAQRGIEATVSWRKAAISPDFVCSVCAAQPGSHCFVPLGADGGNAVIVFGAPARASAGGEVSATVSHCVNALEKQWTNDGSRQWVWLVDFRGFGLTQALNARLGIAFAQVFKDHFPERLKRIVLLNPPLVFKVLISAIGAIADARTLAKIQQIDFETGAQACEQLAERFAITDSDTLRWLNAALDEPSALPNTLPPLPENAKLLQV